MMKTLKIMMFILPLISLLLAACQPVASVLEIVTINGSGTLKTETRDVAGFTSVTLEDYGELTLIQGEEEGLSIEADDNILPLIHTEMQGKELVLKLGEGYAVTDDTTIRYTLKVKDLNKVSILGAGSIRANRLEANNLTLMIAGAGNMTISGLKASKLTAETSGSGNFTLEGEVDAQSLKVDGAGNYLAGDLKSQETSIQIAGAGNATVWAEEKLDVRISGFGIVGYYGNPQVEQNLAGGGNVNSLGKNLRYNSMMMGRWKPARRIPPPFFVSCTNGLQEACQFPEILPRQGIITALCAFLPHYCLTWTAFHATNRWRC